MRKIFLCVMSALAFFQACADEKNENVPAETRYCNASVDDVELSFNSLSTEPGKIAAWNDGAIDFPWFTFTFGHSFGDNHFQGIQRIPGKNYLLLTGSNLDDRGSLIVIKLGSLPGKGAFGSNTDAAGLPGSGEDRVILDLKVGSSELWHPGGFSIVGDIAVVPIENYKPEEGPLQSVITFWDLTDPSAPVALDTLIDRTSGTEQDKAGAASMTRLDDGRFLLVCINNNEAYFYLSDTDFLEDGFTFMVKFNDADIIAGSGMPGGGFGSNGLNFIKQCDGSLYLTSFKKPDASTNEAHLYSVVFEDGDYSAMPSVKRTGLRVFNTQSYGDFDAGAGIYVSPEGRMGLYSVNMWQDSETGDAFKEGDRGVLRIGEFCGADELH